MEHKFKYEIGHEFYLLNAQNNFHKAKIVEREHRTYETRPSQDFYGLQIENWNDGEDWWCTANFISTCAFTEEEMLKRIK